LKTGVIYDLLHSLGNKPVDKDSLKIINSGSVKLVARFFIKTTGISSGPALRESLRE